MAAPIEPLPPSALMSEAEAISRMPAPPGVGKRKETTIGSCTAAMVGSSGGRAPRPTRMK